jgi:hypothetical protein
MPSKTYALIASTSGATTSAGYTFTSIPNTFTDLKLVLFMRANSNTGYSVQGLTFNGDTTSTLYNSFMSGNLGGDYSQQIVGTGAMYIGRGTSNDDAAGFFSSLEIDIINYQSNKFKSAICKTSGNPGATGTNNVLIGTGHWRNTDVITSLNIKDGNGGSYIAGSRASLYGIKAE